MEKLKLDISKIIQNPVLSDMGPAIKSFCLNHSMEQFFCHRHLLQDIGPNSVICFWANRLLKSKNYEDYLKNREFVLAELSDYCDKIGIIPDPDEIKDEIKKKQMTKITVMLNDNFEIEKESCEKNDEIKENNYYILNWCNWVHLENHIARCSNHSEGTHGNINDSLPQKGRRSI